MDFNNLIKPVSIVEEQIISDSDWQQCVNWGESRKGHPEGKIIFHIIEVLKNIEMLEKKISLRDRGDLRIIALLHDSFKCKVNLSHPKIGVNHHGAIARAFAEKYITEKGILDIIEIHDDGYHAWKKNIAGEYKKAEMELDKIEEKLKDKLQLFYLFFKCDTLTGNKNIEPLIWFENYFSNTIEKIKLRP